MADTITDFKTALNNAKKIVFLTGAGVSTASGIPDYRSKTGIYSDVERPEYLLSHTNLVTNPASLYKFAMDNMYFPDAKPNIIHEKFAQISNQKGYLITQNVDGLDKMAGNQNLVEFHGNLYDLYDMKTNEPVSFAEYQKSMYHEPDHGLIRPQITLYEEQIDVNKLEKSIELIENADLIVIVGTSFKVYPFAQLLSYKNNATPVWIINKEQIDQTHQYHEIIGDATEVFAQI